MGIIKLFSFYFKGVPDHSYYLLTYYFRCLFGIKVCQIGIVLLGTILQKRIKIVNDAAVSPYISAALSLYLSVSLLKRLYAPVKSSSCTGVEVAKTILALG